MEKEYFKGVLTTMILVALVVLTFLVLRPILLSVIVGLILAFMFSPIYNYINSKINYGSVTASLLCLFLAILLLLPFWVFTPLVVEQSFKAYQFIQETDFTENLEKLVTVLPVPEDFTSQIISTTKSFISKKSNELLNYFTDLILDFPVIFLQLLVVFFTFFFALKDKGGLEKYIKSLLPFKEEVKTKLFRYSKEITNSVIYGQVIIGLIQGFVVGIGYFIFGVSNPLLLTILSAVVGILPIVGTTLIWIPVTIYLFLDSSVVPAIGILVFGIISSVVDNLIRPFLVSRSTHLNSSVILVGMIGGLLFFGVLGLILGPLIISYLLVILELYRDKQRFKPQPSLINPIKNGA